MSQPQINGGSTSTSGGTNHSGTLTTSAASAATVQQKDQPSACHQPQPCSRCSTGKRRAATVFTTAGVTSTATSSSVASTTSGTDSATTIIGAITARRRLAPILSSQSSMAATRCVCSSAPRTAATEVSQYAQPSAPTAAPASTKGSSDHSTTRGCRQ